MSGSRRVVSGAVVGLVPLAAVAPAHVASAQVLQRPTPGLPSPDVKRVAPRTDVLAVTRLVLSRPVAVMGESVQVSAEVRNTGEQALSDLAWALALPDGSVRKGKIASLAPGATVRVDERITARAVGVGALQFSVDPAGTVEKILKDRLNNSARAELSVLTGSAGQWSEWTRKAAAKVDRLIAVAKLPACVEGSVNGSTLTITRIDPGNVPLSSLTKIVDADGLPAPVAQAIATVFWRAYKSWAEEFRGSHPGAFPAFAAWPTAQAPPLKSAPATIGLLGGSAAGTSAISSREIEAALRKELGARATEPGAPEALREIARSMSAQLVTWTTTQLVLVDGQGPVPSFAPPYVPVGPVVAGKVVRPASGCGHFR